MSDAKKCTLPLCMPPPPIEREFKTFNVYKQTNWNWKILNRLSKLQTTEVRNNIKSACTLNVIQF